MRIVRSIVVLAVLFGSALGAASMSTAVTAAECYAAIRTNDLARLRALAKDGLRDVKDRRGITPLMYAAAVGSIDAMRLLIDAGADVNARNDVGSTALMWSATELAKVELLLNHGADINAISEHGRSVLTVAAMSDGSS